jgi:hypothetical protein
MRIEQASTHRGVAQRQRARLITLEGVGSNPTTAIAERPKDTVNFYCRETAEL